MLFSPALFSRKALPLAAFVATFSASYTLLRPLINKILSRVLGIQEVQKKQLQLSPSLKSREASGGSERSVAKSGEVKIHPLATFLAGTLAGAAIILDSERHGKERRVTLALYFFIRGAEVAYYSGMKRGWLPSFYHGDTMLFTLSCAEIMYSWFYTPETLPPSYVKWITRLANMDTRLMDFLRAKRMGVIELGTRSSILDQYCVDNGLDPTLADLSKGFVSCVAVRFLGLFIPSLIPSTSFLLSQVHPADGIHCSGNSFRRLKNGFLQSLLIYAPVHFLPLIFWRSNALMANPVGELLKT